jgi:mono/diheme cytochrome c family protein
VAACGRCHTPRDTQGRPIPGMELAGGLEFDDGVLGHVVVPNITPDRQTGIGGWTQEQIVIAIREGRRPDGTVIGPPMPFSAYRELSDRDVSAIAAYLRTLKAIRYVAAKSQYKIELPANHGPPVEHVKDLPRQDRLAYGAYLAGPLAHCIGCHTPLREGGQQLDRSRAYAGGRELPDYGRPDRSMVVSRNISPDPDEGIGKWSDAEIKRATVAGIRPDGTRLSHAMPFDWYTRMGPADLDAIVAHLRSVRSQKTPER